MVTLDIMLANVYAPNYDSPAFFLNLMPLVGEAGNTIKIIGGDFNLVLNQAVDQKGTVNTHKKAAELINQVMRQDELLDIWRFRHPDKFAFTWKRLNPSQIFERLDFILVSEVLQSMVVSTDIIPSFKSDHSIPWFSISENESKRDPVFWKLNCSFLGEQEFKDGITKVVREVKAMHFDNPCSKWEMIKLDIQGYSLEYGAHKKRLQNKTIPYLEKRLLHLQELLLVNETMELKQEYTDIQKERDEIIAQQTQGAMVRAKVNWLHYGEKPSKYFFALGKDNYNKKALNRLTLENGQTSKILWTGWPRHRENREFDSYFFQTGKTQGILL